MADGRGDFLRRSAAAARRTRLIRRTVWACGLTVLVSLYVVWLRRPPITGSVEPDYVWAQMLPNGAGQPGGRMVRAIVSSGDRCPVIVINGKRGELRRRLAPVRAAFPVLMCEMEVDNTSEIWIGNTRLPARPADPSTVLVIGDTGCRIAHFPPVQRCHDSGQWPFGQVAERAAATLAADNAASLIIHVGDYHYREKPCADDDLGCGETPYGDNWETWRADFFNPARPLLAAAPWVILRGNHENCSRAGAGWQFFFGLPVENLSGVCKDDGVPYDLNIGGPPAHPRILRVLDTANAGDAYWDNLKRHCDEYPGWVASPTPPNAEVWLAVHQPLWFLGSQADPVRASPMVCEKDKTKDALDSIRAAWLDPARTAAFARVAVVLSGDTHQFQVFRPTDPTHTDMPVQIVAGNGGTSLDKLAEGPPDETRTDRTARSYGVTGAVTAIMQFGFVALRDRASAWTATEYDADGHATTVCDIIAEPKPGPDPATGGACHSP
jgi:hypothetical protein